MTLGIKYYSYPDHSGYGLAALAYVRALHNAGVPVRWVPLVWRAGRPTPWQPEDGLEVLSITCAAECDAALRDVPALLRAADAKDYDTVLIHALPEHWSSLIEPGKCNVGYTAWETDALPEHWPQLLNQADKVLVPCAMNRSLFAAGGVVKPVFAIPHIRRHAWNVITAAERTALRRQLAIDDDDFVFYSIGAWDPRKALGDLVTAFAREFGGRDKVVLVLKTSSAVDPRAANPGPPAGIIRLVENLAAQATATTGKPPPRIAVVAADGIAGRTIDAIHAIGDCYVSLAHGEAWGMAAFDAAALGKPVLLCAFGGPADYLGPDYPGLIEYHMEPVSGWQPESSYRSPQRWAVADPTATSRLLRRMVSHHADFLEPAARRRRGLPGALPG